MLSQMNDENDKDSMCYTDNNEMNNNENSNGNHEDE